VAPLPTQSYWTYLQEHAPGLPAEALWELRDRLRTPSNPALSWPNPPLLELAATFVSAPGAPRLKAIVKIRDVLRAHLRSGHPLIAAHLGMVDALLGQADAAALLRGAQALLARENGLPGGLALPPPDAPVLKDLPRLQALLLAPTANIQGARLLLETLLLVAPGSPLAAEARGHLLALGPATTGLPGEPALADPPGEPAARAPLTSSTDEHPPDLESANRRLRWKSHFEAPGPVTSAPQSPSPRGDYAFRPGALSCPTARQHASSNTLLLKTCPSP